jgi:hypothetical protein
MQLKEQCSLLEHGEKPKIKNEAETDQKMDALKRKLESLMKIRKTKMSKYKSDIKMLSKVIYSHLNYFLQIYYNTNL